jgi:hypothetical protein
MNIVLCDLQANNPFGSVLSGTEPMNIVPRDLQANNPFGSVLSGTEPMNIVPRDLQANNPFAGVLTDPVFRDYCFFFLNLSSVLKTDPISASLRSLE